MPSTLVALVEAVSDVVEPPERLEVVADEADHRVVEAAVAGAADLVVTGDAGLLRPGRYREVRILTPADALAAMEKEGSAE